MRAHAVLELQDQARGRLDSGIGTLFERGELTRHAKVDCVRAHARASACAWARAGVRVPARVSERNASQMQAC